MTSSPSTLYEAMNKSMILEARASMCDFNHNIVVELGCMKGIIPREEGTIGISEGKVRDIALISRVGKPVCFIVEEIHPDEDGRLVAILSRKHAQERTIKEYVSNLKLGDVVNAKITHLEAFGAFCDIGCGNIALLPIDLISVSRISHPADRFNAGEDIRVIIKSIDSSGRITLSHKELLGSWLENAERLRAGDTVSGVVRSIESYGIFVELAPNLAGLAEPKEGVKVGQTAGVYIKSIIPEKMKIKLIIIDSFEEAEPKPYEYFYDRERIEHFVYSPSSSPKNIETFF
jgi:small subunit ribosomal protein S1